MEDIAAVWAMASHAGSGPTLIESMIDEVGSTTLERVLAAERSAAGGTRRLRGERGSRRAVTPARPKAAPRPPRPRAHRPRASGPRGYFSPARS